MNAREKLQLMIEGKEKRHQEEIKSLKALFALMDPTTGEISSAVIHAIQVVQLPPAHPPRRQVRSRPKTLEDAIAFVLKMNHLKHEDITSRYMFETVEGLRYPFDTDAKAAVNTVSTAILKLMDKGLLERTLQGKGREPSRYRWMDKRRDAEDLV